jgi:hypothetical protein
LAEERQAREEAERRQQCAEEDAATQAKAQAEAQAEFAQAKASMAYANAAAHAGNSQSKCIEAPTTPMPLAKAMGVSELQLKRYRVSSHCQCLDFENLPS